jgi:CheY-like chemotaxis protein
MRLLYSSTQSMCFTLDMEIFEYIVTRHRMSNYSDNDNHAPDLMDGAYSHNNSNNQQDINSMQVFLQNQIGVSNSKNANSFNDISTLARVLVVDDEPDISFILKIMLEKRKGFRVDSFNDPKEALHNFRPGLYDLAIIDIKMPKMSGKELYNQMRKVDENTKICFICANEQYYQDIRDQLNVPLQSNYFFLQKPFGNEELLQYVDKLIS